MANLGTKSVTITTEWQEGANINYDSLSMLESMPVKPGTNITLHVEMTSNMSNESADVWLEYGGYVSGSSNKQTINPGESISLEIIIPAPQIETSGSLDVTLYGEAN